MYTRENMDELYRAMVAGFIADKRDRVIPLTGLRKRVIKLDNAMVEEPLGIKGDYVYCDFNSTGVADLALNNTSEDAFPLLALSGVQNIPYDGAFISCTAQPGLVINLWYGYNSQFISPTSAIATIGSITNAVKIADTAGNGIYGVAPLGAFSTGFRYLLMQDQGFKAGVDYVTNANLAINTPGNVFAAASNTAGAIVWKLDQMLAAASNADSSFLSKATAPANTIDGIVHGFWGIQIGAPSWIRQPPLEWAVRIASGLRLDRISGVAETSARATAAYTLL